MKKFLILVALAATTMLCLAKPTLKDISTAKALDDGCIAKPLSATATMMNNFSSQTKGGDSFQGDRKINGKTEVITPQGADFYIASGQVSAGPTNGYYISYDPISKYIFGLSCGRYGLPGDSVRLLGELVFTKYEQNTLLTLYRKFIWDERYPNPEVGTVSTYRYEYQFPTVVVANPLNSENFNDLKISVSTVYTTIPPNTNDQNQTNNYFGITDGYELSDPEVSIMTIENEKFSDPREHEEADYYFNQSLKGQTAYFYGEPYALYFGKLLSNSNLISNGGNNHINYGFAAFNLNHKNDIWAAREKFQLLPKYLTFDLFGEACLTPDNNGTNLVNGEPAMNVDYDKNNNIYFAFNGPNKRMLDNEFWGEFYKYANIPTVIKVPYDPSASDVFAGGYDIDTMPMSVYASYINDNGGVWDTISADVYPQYNVGIYFCKPTDDVPFIVVDEDNYSFIGGVTYEVEGKLRADIIELCKQNGQWRINLIKDVSKTMIARVFGDDKGGDSTAVFIPDGDNAVAFHNFGIWAYAKTATEVNYTYGFWAFSGMRTNDPQISKTADGQYLIAKWRETNRQKSVEKIGYYENFPVAPQLAYGSYPGGRFNVSTDSIWFSEIMLSYRHIDDSVWSEPISAAYAIHDSVSFRNTFMPRIVPSIDEVLISYSIASIQPARYPKQGEIHKLMAYNFASYQYHHLICPSARTETGIKYIDAIKEEGPAEKNKLEVYPNPASFDTEFKFGILKPAKVKLTIQNSLGQEVLVLAEEFCDANDYSIGYNVSTLPVGVYYITLTAGSHIQTKAFTVVR